MIYRPGKGSMWDPSVLWHEGKYYAIMMYNPTGLSPDKASCGLMAVSDDGVHWGKGYVAVTEPGYVEGNVFFKAFIAELRHCFIMNHGVLQANGQQDTLRFYESQNLREWTHLFNSNPQPTWYESGGRWDHMYILPKNEINPAQGYWGYLVATTRPGLPRALGMMETKDGRSWTILPPPEMAWGDVPPFDLEIGGCERIGGKYIIIGGQHNYLSDGYSMYSLISDSPRGPFRPDLQAFRLCGTSSKADGWGGSFGAMGVTMLAAWCRGLDGEKLISNYVSAPSGIWMLPLRKAVFADGHLRLGWWVGNDQLIGPRIDLAISEVTLSGAGQIPRRVTWLTPAFDLRRGVAITGTIRGHALGECASAGFAFPESCGRSLEIRLGIGSPDTRETHIGRYDDVTGFSVEDVTGQGCATVRGIDDGGDHTFRILARHDMFEVYVNDLLVQTYVYRSCGGQIGLLAVNAQVSFRNLGAHAMTLND